MPDLISSLNDPDLGFLRIIAERWGVDLRAQDVRTGFEELSGAIADPQRVAEMLEALPPEARAALDALQRGKGRIPWAEFARRFGAVREMGAGKRDRERPDLVPISAAEVLWYRALATRGFFLTAAGMQEFAFVPDDLLALLPPIPDSDAAYPGHAAEKADTAYPVRATDRILDAACTLLAAQRMAIDWTDESGVPRSALLGMLASAGILDGQGMPQPEATRVFLEAGRGEALQQLFRGWCESTQFNELRILPGIRCEGGWSNDAYRTRQKILEPVCQVPENTWWDLRSFVDAFRERQPDFQRPAGDYDSWFIREEASGQYLRGFERWDEVDGALIRFLLTGPLHWLSALDWAAREPGGKPAAFHVNRWGSALLAGKTPAGLPAESAAIKALSDGRLLVPRLVPRTARYQIARFCAWEGEENDGFHYRITPKSLERARGQGLRLNYLIGLLRKHAAPPPGPNLIQALERWDENGTQARLEDVLVLRVSRPEILAALKRSRAARFLGEPLSATAVIIPATAREKVLTALAELGYLAEAAVSS